MRVGKVFISLATVGVTGGIGAGGYFLLSKSVQVSGKLVFSKKLLGSTEKTEVYGGSLSIDSEYKSDTKQECKIESSVIFCTFLSQSEQKEIEKFLENIGKHERIDSFKQKLENSEIKSKGEEIFSKELYRKLISVINDIREEKFKGKLVFNLEENTETPKSFSVKASLSEDNNDASSDKKIIFKIESFIDKTKVQTYLDSFSLTLSEGEDSKFKEKLKGHLETETNKKSFTDEFGEEIYTNLISILKTNVS